MSARFFKIFLAVLLVHFALLSLVWVGFPVPGARAAAAFVYEGALPISQNSGNTVKSNQVSFDRFEASYFNHWIELRNPSK